MLTFGMPMTIKGRRIDAPGEPERRRVEDFVNCGGTFSEILAVCDADLAGGHIAPDRHARLLGALMEWTDQLIRLDSPEQEQHDDRT